MEKSEAKILRQKQEIRRLVDQLYKAMKENIQLKKELSEKAISR